MRFLLRAFEAWSLRMIPRADGKGEFRGGFVNTVQYENIRAMSKRSTLLS